MLLIALPVACGPADIGFEDPDPPKHDTDADTDTDTDSDTDADSDTDTDADTDADTDTDTDTDTIDTGEVVYDCSALPTANQGETSFNDARAYHGLAFDDDGNLIGWDGRNSLVKSAYDGGREVWVPGFRSVEQIDRLPDGDFVLADTSGSRIARVSADGATETLASDVGYVYGVTVGPDGNIYIADGGVHRVDVKTGEETTLLPSVPGSSAHSLAFNLDSTRLYIGTVGSGNLFYVDLDENLDPISEPEVYAVVGSGWQDAVEIDACGNLYVPDYYTSSFYRVKTDGTVEEWLSAPTSRQYGHGAVYGTGHGGWREDAIYQPQPYNGNTVREVRIGIPSGDTVRTWNGKKAP